MPQDPSEPTLSWGTVPTDDGKWSFGLWAPGAREVAIETAEGRIAAEASDDDVFRAEFPGHAGDRYEVFVDGQSVVDPAARCLPDGVAGPATLSSVRRTGSRPRRDWAEAAILEIHIGTFTPEGTFAAAAARMQDLADLGLTAVELMPVNAFSGGRGWGYDGVFPFAVQPAYGTPQDLADLVGAIHAAGMLAILDVVYNHFGPEGGSLHAAAPAFFDAGRDTPWGPGIDYTRPQVRQFFIQNALMWIRDFGFDGLRLDAVHHIVDPSTVHLLEEMAQALRAAAPDCPVFLIAEDERNLPEARASGVIDANWNDDYHHAMHCLLTGESESYYASFAVDPLADLCRTLAEGHAAQGQPRPPETPARGRPSGHLDPTAFVNANQTHDQVGNRAQGERLISLADPAAVRIAHAILLTAPAVPMLFMGEEEGARAPFLFFADFTGDLGEAVRKGRAAEFAAFSQFGGTVPDPLSPDTFAASRPYDAPAPDAAEWRSLTQQCLTFRAQSVSPLLVSGRAAAAQVRATGPKSLHAVWTFHAGVLEMVAHLGALPEDPLSLDSPAIALGALSDPVHFAVKATRT